MGKNIIDRLMGMFKGIEKDQTTLTTTQGGVSVDLFGPGDEDAYKIGDDFDTIIASLLNDEKGQKVHEKLVESGGIKQLEALWKMGGSPSLMYSSKEDFEADPFHGASYESADYMYEGRAGENQRQWLELEKQGLAKLEPRKDVGTIHIAGGYVKDSFTKFDQWIAELSHGIGHNNPSMMELGKKEYFVDGEKVGQNVAEPTYNFISALGSFPEPQSPQDSLRSYARWEKSLTDEQKKSVRTPPGQSRRNEPQYITEGAMENVTHNRIQSAIQWWLHENLDIKFQEPW